MPRRKKIETFKRVISPDPVYGSQLLQKLINVVMWRGKKNAARKIVYDAMDILVQKTKGDKEKAKKIFNLVSDKFPGTEAAQLAQTALQNLK